MPKYTLMQSIKTLEKLFENGIDTEKKIKSLKWEELKEYSPIEKSFIMDLKEQIGNRNVIGFLAGKEIDEGSKEKRMIEYYKKPSVKFIVNKGNFNKLMEILTFQEKNIVTESWKEKASKLKELLLKYSIPQKNEDGDVSIIDISLFQKEAAELIVLLISAFECLSVDEDYTKLMKRK